MIDEKYRSFCKEIDDFLIGCEDLKEQCNICPPEDHEGRFCHCAQRNILLAKKDRAAGIRHKW